MGPNRTSSRSPLPPPGLTPSRLSPSLAVTGALMLGAAFLAINPEFGVQTRAWPWEVLLGSEWGLLMRVMLGLWVVAALFALGMGLTHARRVRASGVTLLASLLVVYCVAGGSGFVIVDFGLGSLVAMIVLGAGLLLARHIPTRGRGRLLAACGALLLVWTLLTNMVMHGDASPQLQVWLDEVLEFRADPATDFPGRPPHHLWLSVLPQAVVLLAAAIGLLVGLGLPARPVALLGFFTLLAGLLMPLVAGSVVRLTGDGGLQDVLGEVSHGLLGHGVLLFMLSAYAIEDLGRARGEVS